MTLVAVAAAMLALNVPFGYWRAGGEKVCRPWPVPATMCAMFLLAAAACQAADPGTWPDSVHEQGRAIFYQTLVERISVHPDRGLLTEEEIARIGRAEIDYPRLYELLVNIYYQKDEPDFRALLRQPTDEARERFQQMYLDLARFAAERFIDSFFATPAHTAYSRRSIPAYASLDAVDLAVRAAGYFANLDPPEQRRELGELSPEFETQWSLDAARFRQAHEITRGAGARVAILDTGIDETHPVFRDTRWGRHFSLIGREGMPWAADASVVDWGWHGTAISSVVARYAPEAQITMYKIGDGDTQNDPAYQVLMQNIVAASIYRAVRDDNDIISISLSGASLDDPYLREAVRYAHDNNRVVISGSLYHHWQRMGNNLNFPGQYETVISVTAIEKRADGTFGYWDVCAPDDTTTVAAPSSAFLAYPMHALDQEDSYAPSISAAIPVVAALAGLTVAEYPRSGGEKPGEYADTIMRLLTDNANSEIVGFEGFSPQCGYGLIDAEMTVQAAVRLHRQRAGQGDVR